MSETELSAETDRPTETERPTETPSAPGVDVIAPSEADVIAPPIPGSRPMTMTEYEEATSPRAQLARAKGLSAPYIPGGRDPNPEQGLREERHYMRLLIAMVVAIVGGGFALSILYVLVTGGN